MAVVLTVWQLMTEVVIGSEIRVETQVGLGAHASTMPSLSTTQWGGKQRYRCVSYEVILIEYILDSNLHLLPTISRDHCLL